ncbi:MAG TPA: diguanylate cyclase [Rhodanobacter sp.]|nr:diguanylate cyclase [Rhodanobacter sp.]
MKAIEQLRLNGGLPSPKGVALAIMRISRREDATLEEIAKLVQTDPVTTARLLHMANAANFATRPTAGVPEAILRLGLEAVRQLAMGFSLVDQYLTGSCKAFDYSKFWSHSLLMAIAMQELGSVVRIASPDELFACGLLARIGYLALATLYPEEYSRLLTDSSELTPELERQHLHVDHNELTAVILADCGIPCALAEPVFFHETPDASGFTEGSRPYQLTHLFYQAKRLADLGSSSAEQRHGNASELMLLGGKIGLNADELGELVERVQTRWHDWCSLLNVPENKLPSLKELVVPPAVVPLNHPTPDAPRVLWVAHEPSIRALLEDILGNEQNVHSARDGHEGLILALHLLPQIVVVDAHIPHMDSWAFCRALRSTSWGQSIYLILLADMTTPGEINQAVEASINDCVGTSQIATTLPLRMSAARQYVKLLTHWEQDRAQLKQFSAELATSNRKLQRYALTDQLTGLQNRRAGMESLSQAWGHCERSGEPMSMMMIDIDMFKEVNDSHGHATGDKVLIEVACAIRASARKEDSVCRMGGEEFLILCRNADLESARHAAERLRKKVSHLKVKVEGVELGVTISIGVAARNPDMSDPGALVNAADKALYVAKKGGRNRTCVFRNGSSHQEA